MPKKTTDQFIHSNHEYVKLPESGSQIGIRHRVRRLQTRYNSYPSRLFIRKNAIEQEKRKAIADGLYDTQTDTVIKIAFA